MALGGILVANFIFILLLIIFVLFIVSLILFIIFTILHLLDKNKKWKKVLQVITGILTILCLLPLLITHIILSAKQYEQVEYSGKKVKLEKQVIDKFHREITFCDTEKLEEYLNKYPELIKSHSIEGLLPLGDSIKFEKLDCVKYFVNKGQDINKITTSGQWGTLEYMFYYDDYNEDILNYVLDNTNIDVNKRHKALPVAQLYIKSIKKDKEISENEIEIFKKLLNKGLDLTLTDGYGIDTYSYVNDLSDDIINVNKLKELVNKNK